MNTNTKTPQRRNNEVSKCEKDGVDYNNSSPLSLFSAGRRGLVDTCSKSGHPKVIIQAGGAPLGKAGITNLSKADTHSEIVFGYVVVQPTIWIICTDGIASDKPVTHQRQHLNQYLTTPVSISARWLLVATGYWGSRTNQPSL